MADGTNRNEKCIYCGKPSGSPEHLFPSALGGRRKFKGIICDPCNNNFGGTFIARLVEQFRNFAGLIGVWPDRKDEAHVARATAPDGTVVAIDDAGRPTIHRHELVSKHPKPDGSIDVSMRFQSEKHVQLWLTAIRKAGNKVVRLGKRRYGRTFHDELKLETTVGGVDISRALAQIAMNFVGWQFPQEAASTVFDSIKDFITTGAEGNEPFVLSCVRDEGLPNAPFKFSHRVVLVHTTTMGWQARVILFDAFNFWIELSSTPSPGLNDTVRVIDIDPLAKYQPADMTVTSIAVGSIARPTAQTTESEDRETLLNLMHRIDAHHWNKGSESLLTELNTLRHSEASNLFEAVVATLERYPAYARALFRTIGDTYRQTMANEPMAEPLQKILDAWIEVDTNRESGLTQTAEEACLGFSRILAIEVARILSSRDIESDELRVIVNGATGLRYALAMISSILNGRDIFDELDGLAKIDNG